MTKTLTEQWKGRTLKEGWYYLSIVPNKKCIDYMETKKRLQNEQKQEVVF